MPTPDEITRFLKEFKIRMERKKCFQFRDYRGVNRDTITYLCINLTHVKEIIAGLTYEDYFSGPDTSDDPSIVGKLWVFGTLYNGNQLYIKLSDNFSYDVAKCISFHFPDGNMTFPYRRNKKEEGS